MCVLLCVHIHFYTHLYNKLEYMQTTQCVWWYLYYNFCGLLLIVAKVHESTVQSLVYFN